MVKFVPLDDAFSEFFELEASLAEGQSLLPVKMKKKKKRNEKEEEVGHFRVQKSLISVSKHGATEKQVMLQNNAFLSRSELIWPIFRLKISEMFKKMHF